MQSDIKQKLKKISSKALYLNLIVFFLFSSFGIWKFQHALFKENHTIADRGDGLHSITGIAATKWMSVRFPEYYELGFIDKLKANLITSPYFLVKFGLKGDVRPASDQVGSLFGGYTRADKYWTIQKWFLNHFFSPDNVYDMLGLIGFVLIGFAGFILARQLNISLLYSFFCGLLLMNMDNFHERAVGHLMGLADYYMPVFLTWACVKAGKNPTIKNIILFGVFSVLNIAASPYYGYFGLFFSSSLFISFFTGFSIINNEQMPLKKRFLPFVCKTVVAITVFSVFIFLFYPTMAASYFTGIMNNFFSISSEKTPLFIQHSHTYADFIYYSASNIPALFKPGIPFIADLFPEDFFKANIWEFGTFRVGFLPALFLAFSALFFFVIRFSFSSSLKTCFKGISNEVLFIYVIFIPAIVIVTLFGLSPQYYSFSLVPFTFKFVPFLRVGARAFIYVDIAFILLFVFSLDRFLKWALESKQYAIKVSCILLLFLFSFVSLVDVSGGVTGTYTLRKGDICKDFVKEIESDNSEIGKYLWKKLGHYYNGNNVDERFVDGLNLFLDTDEHFQLLFEEKRDIPKKAAYIINQNYNYRRRNLYRLNRKLLGYSYSDHFKAKIRVMTPLWVFRLPDIEIYLSLRDMPKGRIMELPYWTRPAWYSYRYYYNSLFHGCELINVISDKDDFIEFAKKINKPSEEILKELMAAGVLYIAAHRWEGFDFSYLDESPLLTKIAEKDGSSIYEFNIDDTFNTKRFFEDVVMGGKGLTQMFLPSFYGLEKDEYNNWRWCGNRGSVIIASLLEESQDLIIETELYARVGSSIEIKSSEFTETIFFEEELMSFQQKITLSPKSNITINFFACALPVREPRGKREFVFYLKNWSIRRIE